MGVDIDLDIDEDMAVSVHWRSFKGTEGILRPEGPSGVYLQQKL